MNSLTWQLKPFHDLGTDELYKIMQLRIEVFIVEQNCPYIDADNKDQQCLHLMGTGNDKLLAYTRILPPGLSYKEASIGRVVTSPSARREGLGKELMQRTIAEINKLYGNIPIRIGAQFYLVSFYSSLGFKEEGEIYYEDGIKHIEMVKS